MERLSSLDGVFLAIEDAENSMNIGTVAVFDGPPPTLDEVRALVAQRITSVPRCRQRVREPRGALGRPVWIDDVHFDIAAHVRGVTLDGRTPGGLEELVATVLPSPLDRRRPLWELWVVDGLDDDRWAIIAKAHHCMADGIAGRDLLVAIMTPRPETEPATDQARVPAPEPSGAAFAWFNVRSGCGSLVARMRGALAVAAHPRRSAHRARDVLRAAKRLWYRQPHEPTSLVGPIGERRRWTRITVPFADVTTIRAALGGTVNDVVVAAVSCGLRDLLVARGERVEGRTITAMVPVSLRAPAEHGATGNRVANVHALLPVGLDDPRALLRTVRDHLDDLKGSGEIEATGLFLRIGDYVPRVLADRIVRRVLHRQRNVETVITDVPGPRTPLHLGGHYMVEAHPVVPIAGLVRISIGVWSYDDRLCIGITGDRDTTTDLDRLGQGIAHGFAALLDASRTR
jgi:diacylglycerol O-acyltransferase